MIMIMKLAILTAETSQSIFARLKIKTIDYLDLRSNWLIAGQT
jgi:hypothetical protein